MVEVAHLLYGFPEAVEVVLDEALPLKHVLPQQAHQCQEPVDLSEVQHCAVVQSDDGGRVLVVRRPIRFITQPVRGWSQGWGHLTGSTDAH